MTDSTVDDLTAASALDGTEEFYAVQGAADRKVTGTQIKTLTSASPILVTPNIGTPSAGVLNNCTGLPAAGGGTGQSTYVKGDILASPGSNTLNKLAVGTDTHVLTADAASTNGVKWAAGGGGVTVDTTAITGGTTTRLLYDNAGTVGETAGATFVGTGQLTLAAGTLTTSSQPGINITQTWNDGAVAFTGLKVNITNSASTLTNKLFDFQVGGTSRISGAADVDLGNWDTLYLSASKIINQAGFGFSFNCSQQNTYSPYIGYLGLILADTQSLSFTTVSQPQNSNLGDVLLTRAAAATLQQGAADAAAPVAQTTTVQSVVAGTTDAAGMAWTFQSSKGTGTAAGGNIIDKTAFSAKSTGSGQGTAIDRKVIVAKGKVLTDATPVSLFEIALPTLTMCGGQIEATVVCTDGTEMQSFTQTISYSAINKGGVYTKSITASTGDKSVSGGSTIANTWTLLDGTNKVTVQLSSDTSLTPSSNAFLCYYSVKNNSEQATTIL